MENDQKLKEYQKRLQDLKNSFWDLYEMFNEINKDKKKHEHASTLARNVLKARVLSEGIDFKKE